MNESQIIIKVEKKVIRVFLDDLFYITTVRNQEHFLYFVTKNEAYYSRGVLKKYTEKEYPTLFRCHRSTIVNLQAINEINKHDKKIHFIHNQESCHFSKRKRKELINRWENLI